MKTVSTLIIPSAGLGTRLRPATYVTPKEMLRIVDKPAFYYLLAEAQEAGIKKVIFILHKENRQLEHFMKSKKAKEILKDFRGLKVDFVITNKRNGDGQAILDAARHIKKNEAFAVSMGDFISAPQASVIKELKIEYEKKGVPVISVTQVALKDVSLYGVIDNRKSTGPLHKVHGIVEKPKPEEAPSIYAMTAKYILTDAIFPILKNLSKKAKKGEETKLAHALDLLARTSELYAFETVNTSFDMGTKHMLAQTEFAFYMLDQGIKESLRALIKKHA